MADRETLAKQLAIVFHGDDVEWKGFLSKADDLIKLQGPQVITVVMGNDFPDGTFDNLPAANAYCQKKRDDGPHFPNGVSRIYWRTYDFVLNHGE